MANNTTSERFWTLDTVAVINAVGVQTKVRKIVFFPASVDDDAYIQEYGADAVLRTAIHIKANHSSVDPVTLDFGARGRGLNGFKLSVIDGGSLEVYIGEY